MDNITLARILDETAALLEIDAADPFRIRSYRRAAEAVEQQTTQLATLATVDADPKGLLAIAGIGKGMAANIRDLVATGTMPLREELLQKYKPTMLELLRLPGMGPKTVAMVYSALGVGDIDALEEAAKRGDLLTLPRMGQKFTDKLLKGIEDYRKNSSRFRIDVARQHAERISELIRQFPGIDTITPAGSLRRGRESVGDLDLLVRQAIPIGLCRGRSAKESLVRIATIGGHSCGRRLLARSNPRVWDSPHPGDRNRVACRSRNRDCRESETYS